MFLGQIIHQERLKKHFTQSELAANICTQNTISKLEKKNIPPTIPILIRICLRLELTLNELFTEFNAIDTASDESVISAELALLSDNLTPAQSLIADVDFAQNDNAYPAIFHFFKGYLSYRNHESELKVFSAYNSFTAAIADEHSSLKLLLNTGMGLIYDEAGETLANFYFNKNITLISQLDHLNSIDLHRILFATHHTATFLIKQNDFTTALNLIDQVIQISQAHQTINQIDTLYYLKALVLKKLAQDFSEPLATAKIFAKYLKNTELLKQIDQFI